MLRQVIEVPAPQTCQSQHGPCALSLTYCVQDLESEAKLQLKDGLFIYIQK